MRGGAVAAQISALHSQAEQAPWQFETRARQADFSKLDKSVPMIFIDTIKRQDSACFNSHKMTLGLFALVTLLLVWGEIMLYRHYYLRRHPAAALPAAPMKKSHPSLRMGWLFMSS